MNKIFILHLLWFVSLSAIAENENVSIFEKRPDIAKIIGTDPRDIIDARKGVQEIDTAYYKPLQPLPDALSDVSEVFLTANESIPVLYLIAGNPTTLEFTDITGAPWPIVEHRSFSPFLDSKMVSTSSKNSLWAIAQESVGEAVISVYLKDLDTVVSIRCIADGTSYHRNKTVKVMKLGVNAKVNRMTVQEAEEAGSEVDEDLLSAAYGVRPNNSSQMQSSSDAVISWEKEGQLLLYTSLDLMIPKPIRIKTGTANGWTAFRVPKTSRLTFTNEAGNVVKVKLEPKAHSPIAVVEE